MKISEEWKRNLTGIGTAVLLAAVSVYTASSIFTLGWVAIIIVGAVFLGYMYMKKMIDRRHVYLFIVIFFAFSVFYWFNFNPSQITARGAGTVLSDNWWQALNWIEGNTPNCTTVATYWDPGHFITGIGKRAVVFDGASQNVLYTRPTNETKEGVIVEKYENDINHIVLYQNGTKTTARIQDISTTLMTNNETLAYEILKEYRKPGCTEMYYIASSDLIGKSHWWTYFATWDPIKNTGLTGSSYIIAGLSRAQPVGDTILYIYPMGQQQTIQVQQKGAEITPLIQIGNQVLSISRYVTFNADGAGGIFSRPNADVEGTLWIEPSKSQVIFMPEQVEDSLFTRLFFYNGQGLEKFEYVNSWGNEVKLFRIKFDD